MCTFRIVLYTHPSYNPFMKLQHFKVLLTSKLSILYFWTLSALNSAQFTPLRGSYTWLTKYMVVTVLFTHPPRQSIYEVIAHASLCSKLTISDYRVFCHYNPPVRGHCTPWNNTLGQYFCTAIFRWSQPIFPGNILIFWCNYDGVKWPYMREKIRNKHAILAHLKINKNKETVV